jgi:DNA-binding GntR family transcriptional regulator
VNGSTAEARTPSAVATGRPRVMPLRVRDVRDAAVAVRAMHELATREAVPAVTPDDGAAMRAADQRFAAAVRAGDVDAAVATTTEIWTALLSELEETPDGTV